MNKKLALSHRKKLKEIEIMPIDQPHRSDFSSQGKREKKTQLVSNFPSFDFWDCSVSLILIEIFFHKIFLFTFFITNTLFWKSITVIIFQKSPKKIQTDLIVNIHVPSQAQIHYNIQKFKTKMRINKNKWTQNNKRSQIKNFTWFYFFKLF